MALVHEANSDEMETGQSHERSGPLRWRSRTSVDEAITLLQEAIKLAPQQPAGLKNLAWIYATCPDRSFRNGPKAVELARRACELTDWSNAAFA